MEIKNLKNFFKKRKEFIELDAKEFNKLNRDIDFFKEHEIAPNFSLKNIFKGSK